MSDLISRQAAINTAQVMYKRCYENIEDYRDLMVESIKVLPSAQPEQQWIPCSERPPEYSGWYIVTKELDYDTTFVGLEWYDSTNGWKYDNAKCIAWMPLPEPYKGEQE